MTDLPLHDDVRRLAGSLGRVIRRLDGEEAFETVESLRTACRARRHGEPGAPSLDDLLRKVESLSLECAATTARAFTLFFLLINTAEQVQRVRRSRAYRAMENAEPQPGSARAVMRELRVAGRNADDVESAMAGLHVRPVLTAHPTESTRRTLLALQARVADLLLERESAAATEQSVIDEAIDGEVELLWITAEVRHDRPTVLDEVSTVLWYLEARLIDAGARAREALVGAFEEEFGVASDVAARVASEGVPLTIGNWVGGDRDGNPFVTPDVTIATARRASYAILGRYAETLLGLVERLSVSNAIAPASEELLASIESDRKLLPAVYEANHKRNADEPLRLKISFMMARVEASRRLTASRDAGAPIAEPAAYTSAQQLENDLVLVRDSLMHAGAAHACRTIIDPFLATVRAHGLHGFRMDVREHAEVHHAALADIAAKLEMAPLASNALRKELDGRRPLVGAHLVLEESTRRVLETFRAINTIQTEIGERAVNTFIVSMTTSPEDLLTVLLFAREAGLVDLATDEPTSRLDVVPLFETLADLEHAPEVMGQLLRDPIYRRQLAARGNAQEVMIGYSDSGKDAGIVASSWALYEAQEKLAAVFRDAGVELTLFHGRGGSVGRGGGSPVARALAALPPGTVNGRVKVTEQGEIISQQFGLLPVAERTLEVTLAGVLRHELDRAGGVGVSEASSSSGAAGSSDSELAEFREVMSELSQRSLRLYRELVHEHDELFTLFRTATPIEELADARFGSRPAYRPGAGAGIAGIRAIPWGFGWTQIRLMLTGWLGAGTALSEVAATAQGLDVLRRMAARWAFFDDLLGKIEMVCAKTDLEIARAYVSNLGGNVGLLARLEGEFERTVEAVLSIRQATELLSDNPVLKAAIALRNPYVDPLSVLQVALLKRKRLRSDRDEMREAVSAVLATTLSGVAQGLRNTG